MFVEKLNGLQIILILFVSYIQSISAREIVKRRRLWPFTKIQFFTTNQGSAVSMALFEIFVFDVLLAAVHLYSDISLVYTYFDTDNPWWAGVTLFAIALPGILGL